MLNCYSLELAELAEEHSSADGSMRTVLTAMFSFNLAGGRDNGVGTGARGTSGRAGQPRDDGMHSSAVAGTLQTRVDVLETSVTHQYHNSPSLYVPCTGWPIVTSMCFPCCATLTDQVTDSNAPVQLVYGLILQLCVCVLCYL